MTNDKFMNTSPSLLDMNAEVQWPLDLVQLNAAAGEPHYTYRLPMKKDHDCCLDSCLGKLCGVPDQHPKPQSRPKIVDYSSKVVTAPVPHNLSGKISEPDRMFVDSSNEV